MRITGASPLTGGAEVRAGGAAIGAVGSVAGAAALAMLRLDRVVEAIDKGQPLTAGGVAIDVDAAMLAVYRQSLAERAGQPA